MARTKKLLVLVVVMVLAMGLYVAVVKWSEAQEAAEVTTLETIQILSFDAGDVESITWEYEDEGELISYTIKKIDGTWMWPEDEAMELDQSLVADMLASIESLGATQQIEIDDESQCAEYGLDTPVHRISLTFSDDSGIRSISLATGNYSSIAYAYYAMIEEQLSVYLVDGTYMEYFMNSPSILEVEEEEAEEADESDEAEDDEDSADDIATDEEADEAESEE